MTVTLPGGPSGPSFSLAPRLCNGFPGCSFQPLVELLQFSWQVALFHTPETLRGLEQAAVPKPQEPPASHQMHTAAERHRRRMEAVNARVSFVFLGEEILRRREGYVNDQWIMNIGFYLKLSKTYDKTQHLNIQDKELKHILIDFWPQIC